MAHAEGQHHAAAGAHAAAATTAHHVEGQQHPLGIYFKIWGLLFVLSTLSYMVDYFHLQGYLRWTLIIIFMLLKAGLIVAVFMHMLWERLAMVYAILLPPLLLLVLVWIGAGEAGHTFFTRTTFFGQAAAAPAHPQAAHTPPGSSQAAQPQPAQTQPAQTQPAQSQPAQTQPAQPPAAPK
jgi:cytochrome c oxidase subunit IV